LLGVAVHQVHGLVVDRTVHHVLVVVVVHRRLVDIVRHHTLPLGKLTDRVSVLQQDVPMHPVHGLLGDSVTIRGGPPFR